VAHGDAIDGPDVEVKRAMSSTGWLLWDWTWVGGRDRYVTLKAEPEQLPLSSRAPQPGRR